LQERSILLSTLISSHLSHGTIYFLTRFGRNSRLVSGGAAAGLLPLGGLAFGGFDVGATMMGGASLLLARAGDNNNGGDDATPLGPASCSLALPGFSV